MNERLTRLLEAANARRIIAPLTRLETQIATLSPGDRLIAYTLGFLVVAMALLGFYALERSLLVEVPAYGGTLSEGIVGSPRFVNPLLALSDADRDLTALTYAGLMGIGKEGNLVPVLAKSYDVSADGKVYTFLLRDGITFSDGSPVTADDIVFTVTKAQDPALKSPERANWDGIRAEIVDAHTVRFTLAKPYAPFLENTTLGILPARLWRNIVDEQFPFSTLETEPVGAGPFTVRKVSRNASGIVTRYELSAFGGYALGRPYLNGMTFTFFSQESDLTKALTQGTIESAYGVAKKGALSAPYSRVFGVFWNADENPLFSRLEVRKALSIAIDRATITNDVLSGFATPVAGPVPPGSGLPLGANLPDQGGNRIKEAAEVLQKDGWLYDTEARAWKRGKNGTPLTITLKTSNVPELKAVASAIRDDWQLLGVPVSIELYEPGDLNQNVIRPRAYSALLFGMVIGRDRDLFAFWHSSQRNDPGLNIALYASRVVDQLLEKARTESDTALRDADLVKINDLIAADYPAAFTHAPDFLYATPVNLKGVILPQIASPSDRFATVATWYRETEFVWPFLAKNE